jgi:hypothetical protein
MVSLSFGRLPEASNVVPSRVLSLDGNNTNKPQHMSDILYICTKINHLYRDFMINHEQKEGVRGIIACLSVISYHSILITAHFLLIVNRQCKDVLQYVQIHCEPTRDNVHKYVLFTHCDTMNLLYYVREELHDVNCVTC